MFFTWLLVILSGLLGSYWGQLAAHLPNGLSKALMNDEGDLGKVMAAFFKQDPSTHPGFTVLPFAQIASRKLFDIKSFATELFFSLLFIGLTVNNLWTLPTLFFVFISSLLLVLFFCDFNFYLLPDQFTQALLWTGLLGATVPITILPKEAILTSVFGYGAFWLLNQGYLLIRKREGMYPGDFKLNAAIGACFGLEAFLIILFISFVLILATSLILSIIEKSHDSTMMSREIPYGCTTTLAAMIWIVRLLAR